MQNRTEDLLTLRDGEPMDARRRGRLLADPANVDEIARLAATADRLRELPTLAPPSQIWDRVAAEARADRGPGARHHRVRHATAVAAAAAVTVAALIILAFAPWHGDTPERSADGTMLVGVAADHAVDPVVSFALPVDVADVDVIEQSAALEALLATLDRQPQLMSAATADTIAVLEDHIMTVDSRLSYAAAYDADLSIRQALWRERVDVMTALLHVRYAHAESAVSSPLME